jgi:hypothetical protein
MRSLLTQFAASLVINLPVLACAQQYHAEVVMSIGEKPSEIIGVESTPEGLKKIENVKVMDVNDNQIVVTFPVSSSDHLASAIAVEGGQDIRFGPFTYPTLHSSFAKTTCKDDDLTYERLLGQQGALENLVNVRIQRRQLLLSKIALLLENAPRERLMRLENGFGLPSVLPLSETLPADELFSRLLRLLSSIRSYAYQQQVTKAPIETPVQITPPEVIKESAPDSELLRQEGLN